MVIHNRRQPRSLVPTYGVSVPETDEQAPENSDRMVQVSVDDDRKNPLISTKIEFKGTLVFIAADPPISARVEMDETILNRIDKKLASEGNRFMNIETRHALLKYRSVYIPVSVWENTINAIEELSKERGKPIDISVGIRVAGWAMIQGDAKGLIAKAWFLIDEPRRKLIPNLLPIDAGINSDFVLESKRERFLRDILDPSTSHAVEIQLRRHEQRPAIPSRLKKIRVEPKWIGPEAIARFVQQFSQGVKKESLLGIALMTSLREKAGTESQENNETLAKPGKAPELHRSISIILIACDCAIFAIDAYKPKYRNAKKAWKELCNFVEQVFFQPRYVKIFYGDISHLPELLTLSFGRDLKPGMELCNCLNVQQVDAIVQSPIYFCKQENISRILKTARPLEKVLRENGLIPHFERENMSSLISVDPKFWSCRPLPDFALGFAANEAAQLAPLAMILFERYMAKSNAVLSFWLDFPIGYPSMNMDSWSHYVGKHMMSLSSIMVARTATEMMDWARRDVLQREMKGLLDSSNQSLLAHVRDQIANLQGGEKTSGVDYPPAGSESNPIGPATMPKLDHICPVCKVLVLTDQYESHCISDSHRSAQALDDLRACSSFVEASNHVFEVLHRQNEWRARVDEQIEVMVRIKNVSGSVVEINEISQLVVNDEFKFPILKDAVAEPHLGSGSNHSSNSSLSLSSATSSSSSNLGRAITVASNKVVKLIGYFKASHIGSYSTAVLVKYGNGCGCLAQHFRVDVVDDLVESLEPVAAYEPRLMNNSTFKVRTVIRLEDGNDSRKASTKRDGSKGDYEIPKDIENGAKIPFYLEKYMEALPLKERYGERFHVLLWLEELQMNLDIRQYDVEEATFKLVPTISGVCLYELDVPGLAESRPSVLINDYIIAGLVNGTTGYEGKVVQMKDSSVVIRFTGCFDELFNETTKFAVRFQFNRASLIRCHKSLDLLNVSPLRKKWLFPKRRHTKFAILPQCKLSQGLADGLNEEQRKAVAYVIHLRLQPSVAPFVVFGPPGTGKTQTLVASILEVLHRFPKDKVLACAPSNMAVDVIAERIHRYRPKLEMKRYNAHSRKVQDDNKHPYSNYDEISEAFEALQREEIMKQHVLLMTCNLASKLVSHRIPCGHFRWIFIDEAGQAEEPEIMCAIAGIANANTRIVLCGDPKQLGPVVLSKHAADYGLGLSYLERLLQLKAYNDPEKGLTSYVLKLKKNYRSHPAILAYPNKMFYDGDIQAHADVQMREALSHISLLPNRESFPILFYGVHGRDLRECNSPSWFNPDEVSVVVTILEKLIDKYELDPKDIGVITPYRKQVEKLQQAMAIKNLNQVKTASVEEFQGQERRVIIISTVRSSGAYLEFDVHFRLGFVRNPKRFNVALTRAQSLLIVVGDPYVLQDDPIWGDFVKYCQENGACAGKQGKNPANALYSTLISLKSSLEERGSKNPDCIFEEGVSRQTLEEGAILARFVD